MIRKNIREQFSGRIHDNLVVIVLQHLHDIHIRCLGHAVRQAARKYQIIILIQIAKLLIELCDILALDLRSLSVYLCLIATAHLDIDTRQSICNINKIRVHITLHQQRFQSFPGKSRCKADCPVIDTEILQYDGYVDALAARQNLLTCRTIHLVAFEFRQIQNIIQRRVKCNCIYHIFPFLSMRRSRTNTLIL